MTIRRVNYTSNCGLSCGCGDRVILCISDSLTVSGMGFIDGVIVSATTAYGSCGNLNYSYGFTYDGDLLVPGTPLLVGADIAGVICRGCLTTYIDSLTAAVDGLFKPTLGNDWTYVWPPGPPPFPVGDPFVVDVASVDSVHHIVTLSWHSMQILP